MRITALLVSTVIVAGLTPATSAAAATESDYCMAIITTGQSWCASTEAELDSIRARQLGTRRSPRLPPRTWSTCTTRPTAPAPTTPSTAPRATPTPTSTAATPCPLLERPDLLVPGLRQLRDPALPER